MIEAIWRTPIRVVAVRVKVTVVIHITQIIVPIAGIVDGIGYPNYTLFHFTFYFLLFHISD